MQEHQKYQNIINTSLNFSSNQAWSMIKAYQYDGSEEDQKEILFVISDENYNFSLFISIDPKQFVKNEQKKLKVIINFIQEKIQSFLDDSDNFSGFIPEWQSNQDEDNEHLDELLFYYRIARENGPISLQASEILGEFPYWTRNINNSFF